MKKLIILIAIAFSLITVNLAHALDNHSHDHVKIVTDHSTSHDHDDHGDNKTNKETPKKNAMDMSGKFGHSHSHAFEHGIFNYADTYISVSNMDTRKSAFYRSLVESEHVETNLRPPIQN